MLTIIKNYECLIDEDDEYIINKYKWGISNKKGTIYIQVTIKVDGEKRTIQLAREILNAPSDKLVDHINGNTLDNRKSNLRLADKRTNAHNMRRNINTTSKYKGVCWDKFRNKWRSTIKVEDKQRHLGRFETELEAAKAYDEAASKYFGEFARLNLGEFYDI